MYKNLSTIKFLEETKNILQKNSRSFISSFVCQNKVRENEKNDNKEVVTVTATAVSCTAPYKMRLVKWGKCIFVVYLRHSDNFCKAFFSVK